MWSQVFGRGRLIRVNLYIWTPDQAFHRLFHGIADTGARVTTINKGSVLALGYRLKRTTSKVWTLAGKVPTQAAVLTKVRSLGGEVRDLPVKVTDFPEDTKIEVALGMDFLQHFDIFISSKGIIEAKKI